MAIKYRIKLTIEIDVVEEGWLGKPKGLLQVLWERGWVDEKKIGEYSLKGQKHQMDENGKIKDEHRHLVLRTLMMNCADFKEEKSAMEVLLQDLSNKSSNNQSIKLLVSPKYHCELAGEGVEYCWGLSKRFFRNQGLEKKNTKKKFEDIVRQSIEYVKKEHVVKFAGKCRRYMMAYYNARNGAHELTYDWIERFVKKTKTHRNILDQERGFIEEVWRASISL